MSSTATTPGETNPGNFYDSAPLEPNQLYQGEILSDVPIFNMPKPQSSWSLLRTRSGKRIHEALKHGELSGQVFVLDSNQSKEQWYEDRLGDYAMGVLDKRPVLVLSQTCDIETKNFIQVAPIREYTKNGEALERLKKGLILPAFWLKPHPPEINSDSYADFEEIQAVHKTYLKRINLKQHFRLSAERTRMLQSRITRYFGRPNSYDAQSDKAPTTGTYLCVWCFYMDALVTKLELNEGAEFKACPICAHTQWVIKGR